MALKPQESPIIPCVNCPLQTVQGLRPLTQAQIEFMMSFKQGELYVAKNAQMLTQGAVSPHLYTLVQGVVFRFKMLEDGRRQIVNFLFPGDMIGLQGAMEDPLLYGIEAVTEARVCIFQRERFLELFGVHPRLGFDVAWLAAREESSLDEHLTSVGRRSARERIAYSGAVPVPARARDRPQRPDLPQHRADPGADRGHGRPVGGAHQQDAAGAAQVEGDRVDAGPHRHSRHGRGDRLRQI